MNDLSELNGEPHQNAYCHKISLSDGTRAMAIKLT